MAFPRRAQKVAATAPACIADMTTRAVEPWWRKAPVEMSWRGRVMRYRQRKISSSVRPVYWEEGDLCQGGGDKEGDVPTAAFLLWARYMRKDIAMMLRAQAMMFAMFAREPFVPAIAMPQTGFTPTGAVEEFADTLSKTLGEWL